MQMDLICCKVDNVNFRIHVYDILITHKTPFKNLKNSKNQNDFAKHDTKDKNDAMKSVGIITDFLPLVSAKNPHICDDKIIPTNPTELSMLFCSVDKFKSHCAIGRIMLIDTVSRKTQDKLIPVNRITI